MLGYGNEQLKAIAKIINAKQNIQEGVGELDRKKFPQLLSLKYHNTNDAIKILGNIQTINKIFTNFQADLYLDRSVS